MIYLLLKIKFQGDFFQVIDIGEDSLVPEDFSAEEMQSGVWWRHLVAGGVAGCMSRTCTAPLDRLKVFLQVCFFSRVVFPNNRIFCRFIQRFKTVIIYFRPSSICTMKVESGRFGEEMELM